MVGEDNLKRGDVQAQALQALTNLKAVVEAGGSELGKIVKTTVSSPMPFLTFWIIVGHRCSLNRWTILWLSMLFTLNFLEIINLRGLLSKLQGFPKTCLLRSRPLQGVYPPHYSSGIGFHYELASRDADTGGKMDAGVNSKETRCISKSTNST